MKVRERANFKSPNAAALAARAPAAWWRARGGCASRGNARVFFFVLPKVKEHVACLSF